MDQKLRTNDPFEDFAANIAPDAIRRTPHYPAARANFLRAVIAAAPAESDAPLRRLLNDMGRMALFSVIIGHYLNHDEQDRASWPTVGTIRQTFLSLGLSSARSFDSSIARLVAIGFVALARAPVDGRLRLVHPTPLMLDTDIAFLADQFSSVDALYPGQGIAAPLRAGDRRYQRALRYVASRTRSAARMGLVAAGRLAPVIMRQDGLKIVAHYLLAADASGERTVALPFRDLAVTASTSRTHIHNIVDEFAGLGLVRLHRPGGHGVELTDDFLDLSDGFIATTLALYARGWRLACWLVENDPRYAQPFSPQA